MDQLQVGLIGGGGMAKSLARGLAEVKDARIVAVADPAEGVAQAAAEELGGEIEAFTDVKELLAREEIGAAIVAVPNYLHAEMTVRAAEAGKHVFCEKPMALTVADARSMIDACETAGVKLMIGQVLRYGSPAAWMLDRIRSGEFGEPFGMQVTRIGGGWGGRFGQPWRFKRETCGGPLYEINAHEIDLMRQVLGHAVSVYAAMNNFVTPEVDYEDYAQVTVNFQGGGIGSLLGGHAAKMGAYDGKIFLTRGTILFSHQLKEVHWLVEGGEPQVTTYDEAGAGYEPGVQREMREFVEAILDDTDVTIPGIEGLRAIEIAQAAAISAASNRVVGLPL
jgi:predicted dehydrogenase